LDGFVGYSSYQRLMRLASKGARTLLHVAAKIFSKKKGWAPMMLRLAM
jgi:hypothetical protein